MKYLLEIKNTYDLLFVNSHGVVAGETKANILKF